MADEWIHFRTSGPEAERELRELRREEGRYEKEIADLKQEVKLLRATVKKLRKALGRKTVGDKR